MINPDLHPYLTSLAAHRAKFSDQVGHGYSRLILETYAQENRQPLPNGVKVSEQLIPYAGAFLRALVFRPERQSSKAGVLYFHGGAFMEGSPETHFDTTAEISHRLDVTVLSLDYSLAPEHSFPAAVNECIAATHWVFENASQLGFDPHKIILWGDSAGANLATVAALDRATHEPKPIAQILHYPVLDFSRDRPSYTENAAGPIVTLASMDYVDGLYCPDIVDRSDPLAAPLLAQDVTHLPPTFIAVAEHDPLRDDGYAYADKLSAAGVDVAFDSGAGLIHSYLRAVPSSQSAEDAFQRSVDWLRSIL